MTAIIAVPKRYGTFVYLDLARRIKCETQAQKLLLIYFTSHADKDGVFTVGTKRIEIETGLSGKTIHRAKEDFKAVGILDWTQGHGNQHSGVDGVANEYRFDLKKFMKLPRVVITERQEKKAVREARKKAEREARRKGLLKSPPE